MVNFRDFDRISLYTHGRTETPIGHKVGHLDDWLCGVLAARYKWAAVRLDDTSSEHVRARLGCDCDVLNIIVDFHYVPEHWETNVVVFDHHDPNNPTDKCSAHLLMEELFRQGIIRQVPNLMNQINAWDVIGPQAIPPENRPDQDKYFSVLAAEPSEGFTPKEAEFILHMLDRSFSIRQFVNDIFHSETSLGENARRIYSEILSQRERALADIVDTATVLESPSGIRYATITQNPAGITNELFARLKADLIIHPNERTQGALSVVRDSNGRFAITPVASLVEVTQDQVVFQHPGGFLLVAYPPVVVK